MNLIFNGLIPLILLVTLNLLVYSRLRQFSSCVVSTVRVWSVQHREVLLAKISCLIVAGIGWGTFIYYGIHLREGRGVANL